ncbi:hypothetical protein Unana1_07435 [Umbelopsis nana]
MGNNKSKPKRPPPAALAQKQSPSPSKNSMTRVIANREYHNVESSAYVLPKDDQEKDRLHEQHFLLKEYLGGNLLMPDTTLPVLKNGANVLDVGCGPATWLLELATEYPGTNFYGFDIADTFPEAIYPPNMHLQIANILSPLPYTVPFDFVQIRFLTVALRETEWAPAIKHVRDALKPGGLFQFVELNPLINTVDPEMQFIRGHVASLMRKKGQDVDKAANLDILMREANFDVLYKERFDIPLGWGSKADIIAGETHKQVLLGMAPFMSVEMNVDLPTYKAMVEKAAARMGPTKTTITIWGYVARRRD